MFVVSSHSSHFTVAPGIFHLIAVFPFRLTELKRILNLTMDCLHTLSLPEPVMETCCVVLTFESVDEILWCDHSNETSSAALFMDRTISFLIIIFILQMKVGISLEFLFFLGVKVLKAHFKQWQGCLQKFGIYI